MRKLPRVSGAKVIAALRKAGYEIVRQRGSHVILRHPDPHRGRLSIPEHGDVKPGLLRQALKVASLTMDEFRELL
jgi:predicted RNA binding protein YcfA (HicA-like mRNA interferase family)